MRLRRARPEDAEAIERIRVRGWQAAYRHVFPAAELDAMVVDATWWVERLTDPGPGSACFVAEDEAGMVGWSTVGPSALPERLGEVHGLYVDPGRWRHGAGRALLGRGEEELAATWQDAILWTLEDNAPTRRFYEAAGWCPDGTTGSFERFGVVAPTVRYAKRLSSAANRSGSAR